LREDRRLRAVLTLPVSHVERCTIEAFFASMQRHLDAITKALSHEGWKLLLRDFMQALGKLYMQNFVTQTNINGRQHRLKPTAN